MSRVKILSIPLDRVTKAQALDKIKTFIDSGQPHQVTTVNPEFIVEAQTNSEFRSILQKADLSLADGFGATVAARYLGQPLPERIPGADFVDDLMNQAAHNHWKVFLLGGQSGVAALAAQKLKQRYPNLVIVGAHEGIIIEYKHNSYLFNDRETTKLIDSIVLKKPDILLVAFGAPKQDIFISRYKTQLNIPVMIGVGGTFDFIAGKIKRAPTLFRNLGLEWLWRLIQEPKRFKRIYKAVILFSLKVILSPKT